MERYGHEFATDVADARLGANLCECNQHQVLSWALITGNPTSESHCDLVIPEHNQLPNCQLGLHTWGNFEISVVRLKWSNSTPLWHDSAGRLNDKSWREEENTSSRGQSTTGNKTKVGDELIPPAACSVLNGVSDFTRHFLLRSFLVSCKTSSGKKWEHSNTYVCSKAQLVKSSHHAGLQIRLLRLCDELPAVSPATLHRFSATLHRRVIGVKLK